MAVGRLELAKDYPTMLAAFRAVLDQHPEAVLAIVGDGRLRAELKALAGSLGVGEAVQFLGTRADVARLLNGCDGFVLSSAWEGGPIALLEAAAASVPVVSTRVGEAERI